MIDEVEAMPMVRDQHCIRLHMGPLADGIRKHARQWIQMYGERLQEFASQNLASLQELIVVTSLPDLRFFFWGGAACGGELGNSHRQKSAVAGCAWC